MTDEGRKREEVLAAEGGMDRWRTDRGALRRLCYIFGCCALFLCFLFVSRLIFGFSMFDNWQEVQGEAPVLVPDPLPHIITQLSHTQLLEGRVQAQGSQFHLHHPAAQ